MGQTGIPVELQRGSATMMKQIHVAQQTESYWLHMM